MTMTGFILVDHPFHLIILYSARISDSAFQIIARADEDKIIEVGKRLGVRLPKEVILFKKVNLETLPA